MKILFVGEAWGAKEALFQHPFVGASGAELARLLTEVGITASPSAKFPNEMDMIRYWDRCRFANEIDVTNVFNAQPQENRLEEFFTTRDEGDTSLPPLRIKVGTSLRAMYLKKECRHFVESLFDFIAERKPNLIVALGNAACWALLKESGITAIRGNLKLSQRASVKVLPTYHPAAILRQWSWRPTALADLVKAKAEAEFAEIRRKERWFVINPTLAEIASWCAKPASLYAVDIETFRSTITMIGFARSSADAINIPFFDETKPGWSYWPSATEEIQAWRYVHQLLSSAVPKIFQNGVYDITWLLRAGFKPRHCIEDTMLLHHALYPELPKSLGFLGSLYANEISWKQMRHAESKFKKDE